MNLTAEQYAELARSAETLAGNARYLQLHPDADEARRESWQMNVAESAQLISEIILSQDLNRP